MQRKVELKKLREKLMAGTRDSCMDSFDELNHRKIEKTKVEVRSANAKKFMNMFNNGEVPEGMNAGDRTTLEKEAELAQMRKNKRGERDFFKKMENGELNEEKPKEPKLLIGKLKDNWIENEEDPRDKKVWKNPCLRSFFFKTKSNFYFHCLFSSWMRTSRECMRRRSAKPPRF